MAIAQETLEELRAFDGAHNIHPQLAPTPETRPTMMVNGRGAHLVDSTGAEYLDATGGLWLAQVGHGRRELAEAARDQMERLEFFASFWDFTNETEERLQKRQLEHTTLVMGTVECSQVGGAPR